jgi:hypothetical protein
MILYHLYLLSIIFLLKEWCDFSFISQLMAKANPLTTDREAVLTFYRAHPDSENHPAVQPSGAVCQLLLQRRV